jgi:hypothetical protein
MTKLTAGVALAAVLAAGSAFAHHGPATLGTVTVSQPVMADGKTLEPGTYEIRDTGEHVAPLPGQSDDAQAYVEILSNGAVIAREIAEVMPAAPRAVGTSGATGGEASTRLRVERLRGNEFLRIAANRDGSRYLIHLPMQAK